MDPVAKARLEEQAFAAQVAANDAAAERARQFAEQRARLMAS